MLSETPERHLLHPLLTSCAKRMCQCSVCGGAEAGQYSLRMDDGSGLLRKGGMVAMCVLP